MFEVMERRNDRDVIENDDTDRKHLYPRAPCRCMGYRRLGRVHGRKWKVLEQCGAA